VERAEESPDQKAPCRHGQTAVLLRAVGRASLGGHATVCIPHSTWITAVLIPCAQPHTVAAPSAWPAALNLSRMMESHRNTTLC
jgi:hypothetical protein